MIKTPVMFRRIGGLVQPVVVVPGKKDKASPGGGSSRPRGGGGGGPLSYRAAVLALSPTAYYQYENTSGTVVVDESGNGRNGAYIGGANSSAPGLLGVGTGSGRKFSTSVSQYHTAPNAVYAGGAGFSVAFLIRFAGGANTVIFERGSTNDLSIQTLNGITNPPQHLAGAIGLASGTTDVKVVVRSSMAINDSQTHFVVLIHGPTHAECFCVVDGVDVSVRPDVYKSPSPSASAWQVGSRSGSTGYGGALDELAFFNYPLTVENAQALYAARLVP